MLAQCLAVWMSVLVAGPASQFQPQGDKPIVVDEQPSGQVTAQDAQPPGESAQPGGQGRPQRDSWRSRRGPGGDNRGPRQWRQQFMTASPMEQDQLRLERWVDMTTRLYDLTDAQQQTVRREMEAIRNDRRVAMGPDVQEYERIRSQMHELRAAMPMTESEDRGERREQWRRLRDDPEYSKLREQLREIEDRHPFDFEAAMSRIEAVLPADQVAKGRAEREQWRQRREQRRAEREREGTVEQLRPDAAREQAEAAARQSEEAARAAARQAEEAARAAQRQAQEQAAGQPAQPAAKPVHPWEQYTRDFINRHDLTPEQGNAAMSILKGLLARAEKTEKANADRLAAAEKIADKAAREKRLAELRAQVDRLFDELKARLDNLLTATQRAKAKPSKSV